ncbi:MULTISPECIES: dimethylsulfonioproprionate lyase family protein [Micromonospora]|uniref:dimethylsulfonioproprionate lyase family protein n=1 Tax=Micromonospora TaxID=1873 RepID=UPI0003EEB19B|nr:MULTISPECIES: dimethylsulfonioproprionate lyase family protein [Micromonospora]EWM64956.1 cupin [Micromonospora sp. M42]MBC8989772.1 cupin domain-containing protein [Micromonospora chalcea]MCK1804751.1 dimethylsulfonioproprionate lyase family protein [Micromonospora sp. R42106]MCK1832338.1 dimethylsulfonioproprionate lyase family protein [Micromonospora sp. R42003]MCK1843727.1 dimethylsulfonioproprionate lyase family protein [Micromonospora sp. R42004]
MTALPGRGRRIAAGDAGAGAVRPAFVVHRDELAYELISSLNHNTDDEGLVHRLVDRQLTGDPDCEFLNGVYRMEPRMTHPLHLHADSAEFYYVLSGTALFRVADEEFEAGPGTAMYIPAGVAHAITTGGEHAMELLYSFSTPDLNEIGTRWL